MTRLPLKANACFAQFDHHGFCDPDQPGLAGVFLHDTRHLSRYQWQIEDCVLVHQEATLTGVTQFWSRFEEHTQKLLVRRDLTLNADGLTDRLEITNEALKPETLTLSLTVEADFNDVFELRGRDRGIAKNDVLSAGSRFEYVAQDGVKSTTTVAVNGLGDGETVTLAPGDGRVVTAQVTFSTTLERPFAVPRIEWSASASALRSGPSGPAAQACRDIEALATSAPEGVFLAAGIPNFVAPFGRDGLIAAWFLLDAAPALAEGILRVLAAHQGQKEDLVTAEEPGKIAHELRYGELSRTGDVPFARYFGTTDATALFIKLLRDHALRTGSDALVRELAPTLKAATMWLLASQDNQGLVRYPAHRVGRGLLNTSWKDSDDSISYSDGRLATGRIAVVEIQGYAAEALAAAADLLEPLGSPAADIADLRRRAADLTETIDRLFWNRRLGLHVVALDEDGAQCDIATSNPGHLLWAGVLSEERAAAVADRMMEPDLWSGWGLRTLACGEKRYQPLSYHNGSVWPHDTAIFAAGCARYDLPQAAIVKRALHDLSLQQPRFQLPELLSGYARDGSVPPLAYIESCRPQAWAAAALIWATI